MYNLLLHTSDEHFLKIATEYKKFCVRGASKGTCGVCGVTGLNNGGKKLTLTSLRYLIRRGDQYDDSKYGKFKRELSDARDAKAAEIARLRLDTLHTYTHPIERTPKITQSRYYTHTRTRIQISLTEEQPHPR